MSGPHIKGPYINPTQHFVFQRVHSLDGKILHLDAHLDLLSRAFRQVYGFDPAFNSNHSSCLSSASIAHQIAMELRAAHFPSKGSATAIICLSTNDNSDQHTTNSPKINILPERALFDLGYAHSSLRPAGVTFEYSVPFSAFPTGFHLSAAALFDTLAANQSATPSAANPSTVSRSIRRSGNFLISCGDSPLFAIRGRALSSPPLVSGAIDSIERRLVIEAAPKARLTFVEEPIPHSELTSLEELFFADAAGLTSFSSCDGAKFMSLLASKLAPLLARD